METLAQDLRYSLRVLLKSPGFTIVAVLALTIGIGANTAIFSVVNSILLRPLPYRQSERIVTLWTTNPNIHIGFDMFPNTAAQFVSYRDQSQVFEKLAAYKSNQYSLENRGEPEKLGGVLVSADFFAALGVDALIGRTFVPEEDTPGKDGEVVMSHSLWQRRFGGDPGIVGQAITLNGRSYTVVGIMPKGFGFPRGSEMPSYMEFPAQTDIWTPVAFTADEVANRIGFNNALIGRLRPGVPIRQAQTQLSAIAARNAREFPDSESGMDIAIVPLRDQIVGGVRPALLVMLGAVGFVLLIACVNFANLLLARAASRYREIALRAALGASRWRIIRQLLTESVSISLIGATFGLILAFWGIKALIAAAPQNLPGIKDVSLDWRVLAFTLTLAVATGIIFGLVPAWQMSRPDLNASLKEGGRGATEGRHLLREALVIAEVSLAVVLLIGAGLMIRSFERLYSVKLGIDPTNVLTMQLNISGATYEKREQRVSFGQRALDRIRALPGVESVAVASEVPLSGSEDIEPILIEGQPFASSLDKQPLVSPHSVTPDYFRTMRIPLLQGREFTEHDKVGSPEVVIANPAFVKRYMPGENPVGKRIRFGRPQDTDQPWLQIIGLAGDVRHSALDQEPKPTLYRPFLQNPYSELNLILRTYGKPLDYGDRVKREVWAVDGGIPVYNIATMNEIVATSVAQQRFNLMLMAIFAIIALALASVGIYGLMSYSVAQRTHEIGIRMALGAQRSSVLGMILKHGMVLVLVGLAVGVGAAFGLTRLIATMLYSTSATDPLTFVGISVVLGLVALVANLIPALRATKIDPLIALRYE